MRIGTILLAAALITGCARYEYDLTAPSGLTRHIAQNTQTEVLDDPLVYQMQAVESRLVIWIQNPTADPIELLGVKSQAIDPDGVAHPLKGQTIAPGGIIKLILPPIVERGPSGGDSAFVRSETDIDRQREMSVIHPQSQPPDLNAPQSDRGDESSDDLSFDWDGQTDVHLNLTFTRHGREFQQNMVFHRRKAG